MPSWGRASRIERNAHQRDIRCRPDDRLLRVLPAEDGGGCPGALREHLAAGEAAAVVCLGHRSEEHTSELQSLRHLVCRLLLEKKKRHNNRGGLSYHVLDWSHEVRASCAV